MHQALLVYEVLVEIFRHLDENLDPFKKPSLAALARTCKTFHEPAMDLLWAKLEAATPLLGCVPRLHQLIYRSGSRYPWDWSNSVEPLSELEARQFLRHAARVRSLNVSLLYGQFHLYSVLPLETCMFPGLLSLSFMAERPQNKYLYLFLSPTLRSCLLPYVHPDLKSIVTRCPALEHLRISERDRSTADELTLLSDSVRLCKQLVTLSGPPLDWAAWKHLSNLSSLLEVQILVPYSAPSWPLDRDMVNFAPFINVTSLFFHAKTAAHTIAVMQHSEFPSLIHFHIGVNILPLAEAEQLLRALSRCKAKQILEHISIYSSGRLQEPSDSCFTVVPYFLSFTQLRVLNLRLHFCIHLDNDRLLEAISSWPHIHTLRLVDPQMPPAIAFCGLFAALRLRPHLHTLSILMDAVNIDIDPKAESFQHPGLQELDVTYSEIADAEAVARIIFSMLPSIVRVSHQHDRDTGMRFRKLWNEVNRHIKAFNGHNVTEQVSGWLTDESDEETG